MAPIPKDLGQKLLSARADRIRTIVRAVVGSETLAVDPLPEKRGSDKPRLFSLRGATKGRNEAIAAAASVVEGLLNREPAGIRKHLHDQIWMIWPDGSLKKHATEALLDALAKSTGKAAPLIIEDKLSYNAGELRSVLPRGVPESLERWLDVQNVLVVTMRLEGRDGPAGVVQVLMSPDPDGKWRAHNLLFPSFDDAVRASTVPSNSDDEALRFADRIVRHFLLGHDRQLKSLRNHFGERVLFGEEIVAPEKIFELAAKDAHRADALDLVFGSVRLVELSEIPAGDRIKRRAQEYWKRAFEKLVMKAVAVRAGERDVHVVMIKTEERHRLAALFS